MSPFSLLLEKLDALRHLTLLGILLFLATAVLFFIDRHVLSRHLSRSMYRIYLNTEKIMSATVSDQQALADLQTITQDIQAKVTDLDLAKAGIETALTTIEQQVANGGARPGISADAVEQVVTALKTARDAMTGITTSLAAAGAAAVPALAPPAPAPTPASGGPALAVDQTLPTTAPQN